MTTDFLEAPQPCEQNSRGDNTAQMLFKDCDMRSFAGLNDRGFSMKDSAGQHLPDMTISISDSTYNLSDLNKNVFDMRSPRAPEHLGQIQNAEKQLPGLLAKSGATADGRSGLTQKDIEKLERDHASGQTRLTREEQEALKFMKQNYDKLKNGRTVDIPILGRVGAEGITTDSFDRNKLGTDPVERTNPRDRQPRDQRRADTTVQPARDFGDSKVVSGGGPWHVAEKMLKGQDLDHKSQQDLTTVLQKELGVDWKSVRAGTELINEQNLERVRRAIEATRNPKLAEWFNKRYPKA